ncbi:MAG: hypothetical protein RL316_947 [Bacteroidota bacterium]
MHYDCGDPSRLGEFNRLTVREVILLMLIHNGVVLGDPLPRHLIHLVGSIGLQPIRHEGVIEVADVDEGEVSGIHTSIEYCA